MDITTDLGQKIIKRISEYTDAQINIMNLNGMIVASTDKSRISTIHAGAMEVINTGNELTLDKQTVLHYPGTKPGVNLPIQHQNKLTGVVGVSGHPEETQKISGLIRAAVEIVIDQIHTQRQSSYQERQWNYWLQQLLHPSGFNEMSLEKEAQYTLNINTQNYWRIIILKGKGIQNSLEMVREEINQIKVNFLFVLPFSENMIVICVTSKFRRVEALINRFDKMISNSFRVGVGEVSYGIVGIRESYLLAKQALLMAKNNMKISYSEYWKLRRLITSIPKSEYDRICLPYEKQLNKLGEEYLRTIDIYLEMNFSVKETAEILHIHRNTLIYRLDRIEEVTGLTPRNLEDAMLLKVIRSWEI